MGFRIGLRLFRHSTSMPFMSTMSFPFLSQISSTSFPISTGCRLPFTRMTIGVSPVTLALLAPIPGVPCITFFMVVASSPR